MQVYRPHIIIADVNDNRLGMPNNLTEYEVLPFL